MKKVVTADYDPATKTLTLLQPLEGVSNADEVHIELPARRAPLAPGEERPWMKYRGILKGEAGDELAAVIEEMFPTEK